MIECLLLLVLALLQVGDWWTTSRALAKGAREINLIEVWLMARLGSVDRALLAKGLFVVALGLVGILLLPGSWAIGALAVVIAIYLAVVIHNWDQI